MQNLTQFVELHKEGQIRFTSFYTSKTGYTLVMNDMNDEFESGVQFFDGNSVDECITQAQEWIDTIIREDREASENARDEQDDGMEHPDTI